MALGDGNHKLPVKAETLRAIGKAPGQTIKVTLLSESDNSQEPKWQIIRAGAAFLLLFQKKHGTKCV